MFFTRLTNKLLNPSQFFFLYLVVKITLHKEVRELSSASSIYNIDGKILYRTQTNGKTSSQALVNIAFLHKTVLVLVKIFIREQEIYEPDS